MERLSHYLGRTYCAVVKPIEIRGIYFQVNIHRTALQLQSHSQLPGCRPLELIGAYWRINGVRIVVTD